MPITQNNCPEGGYHDVPETNGIWLLVDAPVGAALPVDMCRKCNMLIVRFVPMDAIKEPDNGK